MLQVIRKEENHGGRGGIRTHEALITPTRFPVARTRPTMRPFHIFEQPFAPLAIRL